MTASIKPVEIAKAMYREGKQKQLCAKWYAMTKDQCVAEIEAIVRNDKLMITDSNFRSKYAAYIKA